MMISGSCRFVETKESKKEAIYIKAIGQQVDGHDKHIM